MATKKWRATVECKVRRPMTREKTTYRSKFFANLDRAWSWADRAAEKAGHGCRPAVEMRRSARPSIIEARAKRAAGLSGAREPCTYPRKPDGKIDLHALEERAVKAAPFRDDEGIEGRLRLEEYAATYPYPHTVRRLSFVPTAAGKRSDAYQRIREKLRDDWSTDITASGPDVWSKYIHRALRCRPE